MVSFYQDRKRFKAVFLWVVHPGRKGKRQLRQGSAPRCRKRLGGSERGGLVAAINTSTELSRSLREGYIGYGKVFEGGKEGDASSGLGCAMGGRC